MLTIPVSPGRISLLIAAAFSVGCATTSPTLKPQSSVMPATHGAKAAFTGPAVIAVNGVTGGLEYWPMQKGGSRHPVELSKLNLFYSYGMAANGNVVAIAVQNRSEVLEYDVSTGAVSTLPDPYGSPQDIAIGKDASIYVVNSASGEGNVTMYPGGSSNPVELTCPFLDRGGNIAVDNEGDIFVSALGFKNKEGVVEIPNGPNGPEPRRCMQLTQLLPVDGFTDGLVIDPKTDALVVLDNPGGCAGGDAGRMMIYHKPYKAQTALVRVVGQNCSIGLRLSADSSVVFVLDEDVSGSNPVVLARSFPGGGRLGSYRNGQAYSVTTIPNTLPN